MNGALGCSIPFAGDNLPYYGGGGSGTVTSVSVTPAAGVSGSVTNPTTTPAITIVLGNITPTSVNTVVISGASTPTLTVTGTTTVSGTNTGDQIEFPDNTFRIYDNVDTTKKVAFETSGITPAITRTLTVPDENGTITLNTATQTLTNKTVVTPIIQTGMDLVGGTSGTVTIDVPAIITDYTLILPPAQGTGALTNDGTGNLSWGGTTGIVGWTPALNTSVPNNTVNASTFTASGGTTNQDAVISPKGTGAFQLDVADGTATGGDKRGQNAIDLQSLRSAADKVASGNYSFVGGYDNKATSPAAIAIGNTNTATGNGSIAIGELNTATGQASVAMGAQNTAGGINAAVALGKENVASGENSIAMGYINISSGDFTATIGTSNTNAGANSFVTGQGLTFTSAADNSFGFLSNPLQAFNMTIAAPNTAVFGNVNMWLANNDNTARELRFYEPYNTTGAFPNTANYTAFKAQAQTADVTYTLPAADGSSGNILSTNGSGVLSWITAAAGSVTTVSVVTANGISGTVANPTTTPAITLALDGIITSLNTASPNNTVNASRVLATGGTTDQDLVLQPKGIGAVMLNLPDGTATGGNKRGDGAIDLNLGRDTAVQVASGPYSFTAGYGNNTTTSVCGTAIGDRNYTAGPGTTAIGYTNTASGTGAVALGWLNTASGANANIAIGRQNSATGEGSIAIGRDNVVVGQRSAAIGRGLTFDVSADNSFGYLANDSLNSFPMTISANNTTVFGNTNLWLANNDNTARELRFYEPYNTTGAFPNTANYTAFKAQAQTADVTYTLPAADGASGSVLATNGSGALSWASPGGGGTVTTVSVVTANGISGSVANATTTPAITLALAGFTPSLNTASPNNTINASMLLASGGTTHQDIVIAPKGDGAIQVQLADGTTTGGNKRGTGAIDLQLLRSAAAQVASGAYAATVGGYSNTASGIAAVVIGGNANVASNQFSAVIGGGSNVASGIVSVAMGQGMTISGSRSFGFNGNSASYLNPMTVSADNTAVFANANMWLANNDNTARELRFYEPYNTTGAFPGTANYTAFKAQAQSADVTYTLPAADGSNGNVLTTNGSGALSWTTAAAGTVTTVSVVTANGVSGSVANATTTPAITITLGAITPTTVNGMTITTTTGTLTLASGSSLVTSGANSITFTSTGPTTVTLPTSGTLMANPMTTGGDVIYGGASGAPTRLANGSSGQVLTSAGGTAAPTWSTIVGLTGFTSSLNTASPNNTVNASQLLASGGSTNQDAVVQPKGTGAFQTQLADSTTTGGNKRGTYAVDLQMDRNAANQVASGNYSLVSGSRSRATGTYSVALGFTNLASAQSAVAIGESCTASGTSAVALGNNCTASGSNSFAVGSANTASSSNSFAAGSSNTASASNSVALGASNTAAGSGSMAIGNNSATTQIGQFSHSTGRFAANGDAQTSQFIVKNTTTNNTQTELYVVATIPVSIASGTTYAFEVRVSGRRTDTPGSSYHAVIEGTISNNSGTTALDGLNTMRVITNTAGTWSAVVEADNTNDALVVKVTGASGATIRWVAAIKTVEVAS